MHILPVLATRQSICIRFRSNPHIGNCKCRSGALDTNSTLHKFLDSMNTLILFPF